jgi:hypothetical protein
MAVKQPAKVKNRGRPRLKKAASSRRSASGGLSTRDLTIGKPEISSPIGPIPTFDPRFFLKNLAAGKSSQDY